jgi:hypothetical protein
MIMSRGDKTKAGGQIARALPRDWPLPLPLPPAPDSRGAGKVSAALQLGWLHGVYIARWSFLLFNAVWGVVKSKVLRSSELRRGI